METELTLGPTVPITGAILEMIEKTAKAYTISAMEIGIQEVFAMADWTGMVLILGPPELSL